VSVSNAPAVPVFSPGLFEFSGQSCIDAWTIGEAVAAVGWSRYDYALSHQPELCFQRIRDLVSQFPTWQRRNGFGRPETDEREILTGLLLRQFLDSTFRQVESFMRILRHFFGFNHVPDATTLSLKNRSHRFVHLLRRFHEFALEQLPKRKAIIATDATGFGTGKPAWRTTDYGFRAGRTWTKVNCAVEVPQLLVLSATFMRTSRRHESQAFADTWSKLPTNVEPTRSLADSAYSGQPCLEVAVAHGATPLHAIKENAKHRARPAIEYDRLVNFATHWPNRFQALTGRRALVETTFSKIKEIFGERLRCRTRIGRVNEAQAKLAAHNIRVLVNRQLIAGAPS
jgi:hypothetical protein